MVSSILLLVHLVLGIVVEGRVGSVLGGARVASGCHGLLSVLLVALRRTVRLRVAGVMQRLQLLVHLVLGVKVERRVTVGAGGAWVARLTICKQGRRTLESSVTITIVERRTAGKILPRSNALEPMDYRCDNRRFGCPPTIVKFQTQHLIT
jgi:hypothetical protein